MCRSPLNILRKSVIVSPFTHGTPPQVLGAPSSNSSVPQTFKGMREDEVLKGSGVLKSGVHCLAFFRRRMRSGKWSIYFPRFWVSWNLEILWTCSRYDAELFECMISNAQLVHIFSTLLQPPRSSGHLQMCWLISFFLVQCFEHFLEVNLDFYCRT
ncbi:uncharacterized protein LOC130759412 [Actinidia eriantha]|uniref:uncharacterized protein LOC130759412 n=1 Tax=Actinidia eriantha TaxID=165200 RepID=UPI0025909B2E|nr:uncharacterized protein LOC130759412 [Actinidia eriantha]